MPTRLARLATATAAAAVAVLSLLPIERAVGSGYGDKLDHLTAYGMLGTLATLGWGPRIGNWPVIAACTAFGGALELLQTLSPGRVASFGDLAANGMGALIGAAAGRVLIRRWQADPR